MWILFLSFVLIIRESEGLWNRIESDSWAFEQIKLRRNGGLSIWWFRQPFWDEKSHRSRFTSVLTQLSFHHKQLKQHRKNWRENIPGVTCSEQTKILQTSEKTTPVQQGCWGRLVTFWSGMSVAGAPCLPHAKKGKCPCSVHSRLCFLLFSSSSSSFSSSSTTTSSSSVLLLFSNSIPWILTRRLQTLNSTGGKTNHSSDTLNITDTNLVHFYSKKLFSKPSMKTSLQVFSPEHKKKMENRRVSLLFLHLFFPGLLFLFIAHPEKEHLTFFFDLETENDSGLELLQCNNTACKLVSIPGCAGLEQIKLGDLHRWAPVGLQREKKSVRILGRSRACFSLFCGCT